MTELVRPSTVYVSNSDASNIARSLSDDGAHVKSCRTDMGNDKMDDAPVIYSDHEIIPVLVVTSAKAVR